MFMEELIGKALVVLELYAVMMLGALLSDG
jgi:hypothetical protein